MPLETRPILQSRGLDTSFFNLAPSYVQTVSYTPEPANTLYTQQQYEEDCSRIFGQTESKKKETKPKYVSGIRASKDGDITCGMCPYMRDGVCDKHKHGLGYNVKVYKTWTCDKAERKA